MAIRPETPKTRNSSQSTGRDLRKLISSKRAPVHQDCERAELPIFRELPLPDARLQGALAVIPQHRE